MKGDHLLWEHAKYAIWLCVEGLPVGRYAIYVAVGLSSTCPAPGLAHALHWATLQPSS